MFKRRFSSVFSPTPPSRCASHHPSLISSLPPFHPSCGVVCNRRLTQGPVIRADELPVISFFFSPQKLFCHLCTHPFILLSISLLPFSSSLLLPVSAVSVAGSIIVAVFLFSFVAPLSASLKAVMYGIHTQYAAQSNFVSNYTPTVRGTSAHSTEENILFPMTVHLHRLYAVKEDASSHTLRCKHAENTRRELLFHVCLCLGACYLAAVVPLLLLFLFRPLKI